MKKKVLCCVSRSRLASICVYLSLILPGPVANAADLALNCEKDLIQAAPQGDPRVLGARVFSSKISPQRLRHYIEYLNGEKKLPGGVSLSNRREDDNREVVRQALAMKLRDLGYRPEFESFSNPSGANVVVEIPGSDLAHEVLELGAHFDTIERGADDNAAGVALLVHIAELLKRYPPARTIRLVFYDLEELDCNGSCHHVLQIQKDPRKFLGSLIVDSIGYFPKTHGPRVTAEIGPGDLALPLARELFYQVRRLPIDRGLQFSAEREQVDGETADHGPYWKSGHPAILFARPFGDEFDSPYNHGRHDTTANMNWDYYMNAARLFAELVGFSGRIKMDTQTAQSLPEAVLENQAFHLEVEGQILPEPVPEPHQPTQKDSVETDSQDSPRWLKSLKGLFGKS